MLNSAEPARFCPLSQISTQLVMYEEEFNRINGVCDRLTKDANAKVVEAEAKLNAALTCAWKARACRPCRPR